MSYLDTDWEHHAMPDELEQQAEQIIRDATRVVDWLPPGRYSLTTLMNAESIAEACGHTFLYPTPTEPGRVIPVAALVEARQCRERAAELRSEREAWTPPEPIRLPALPTITAEPAFRCTVCGLERVAFAHFSTPEHVAKRAERLARRDQPAPADAERRLAERAHAVAEAVGGA